MRDHALERAFLASGFHEILRDRIFRMRLTVGAQDCSARHSANSGVLPVRLNNRDGY